jgi:hypothetical protein
MRPTRYETVLISPDDRRFLILYTARRSFPGLMAVLRQRGRELCDRLSLDDSARATRGGSGRFPTLSLGNGWTAGFSGRTQLECEQSGELPWIFSPRA